MQSQKLQSRRINWTTKVMYCTEGYCKAITTNFSMTFLRSSFQIKYRYFKPNSVEWIISQVKSSKRRAVKFTTQLVTVIRIWYVVYVCYKLLISWTCLRKDPCYYMAKSGVRVKYTGIQLFINMKGCLFFTFEMSIS